MTNTDPNEAEYPTKPADFLGDPGAILPDADEDSVPMPGQDAPETAAQEAAEVTEPPTEVSDAKN